MTTICYKDGILAADTQTTFGNTITLGFNKIKEFTHDNKSYILASTGGMYAGEKVVEWIKTHGVDFKDFVKTDNTNWEFFLYDGENAYSFNCEMVLVPLDLTKVFVLGSGSDIALGAMEAGVSAMEAVEIAIKYDVYTGGDIKTIIVNSNNTCNIEIGRKYKTQSGFVKITSRDTESAYCFSGWHVDRKGIEELLGYTVDGKACNRENNIVNTSSYYEF